METVDISSDTSESSSKKHFSHQIIGHRGGSGIFGPENLLHTLKKAVEVGVKLLEFDIRSTKDGYLVICHDDENWFGIISEMNFDELRQIDAAEQWSPDGVEYPLKGKGLKIATLEEVFDEFSSNGDILFFLDFKSEGIAEKVFNVVNTYNLTSRIIAGAMDETINIEMLKKKPKEVPSTSSLNESIQVWVFGPYVNDPETQTYLIKELKVDAIIADYPDEALRNYQTTVVATNI